MTDEPRYIVIRAEPGCPPGWLPESYDGTWYDKPDTGVFARELYPGTRPVRFYATGETERRDDGELASVYRLRAPRWEHDQVAGIWRLLDDTRSEIGTISDQLILAAVGAGDGDVLAAECKRRWNSIPDPLI